MSSIFNNITKKTDPIVVHVLRWLIIINDIRLFVIINQIMDDQKYGERK